MGRFGTDGIRGVAGHGPLEAGEVRRLGFEAGRMLRDRSGDRDLLAVIGRDTRVSGPALEEAVAAGLREGGLSTLRVGVIPTPAIAYLTRKLSAALGVVISASHNPPEDNGIKFIGPDGMKIPDSDEAAIETRLDGPNSMKSPRARTEIARPFDPVKEYARWAAGTCGVPLKGMKLVVDCGFGASVVTAPLVLKELGADATWLNADGDGGRINVRCGATHPNVAAAQVVARGASAGISFDGDQDRAILCDERGSIVDGDHVLAMWAARRSPATVVGTVMSNWGLEKFCIDRGIRLVRTAVGDRFVSEAMLREKAPVGGEPSGHVIFADLLPTGDGMVTALQVLRLMVETGSPLSKLASILTKCPQVLKAVRVANKPPLEEFPEIQRAIREAQARLGTAGRLLVRYSGTENICRVMVEGIDAALIEKLAAGLCDAVAKSLANA